MQEQRMQGLKKHLDLDQAYITHIPLPNEAIKDNLRVVYYAATWRSAFKKKQQKFTLKKILYISGNETLLL